MHQKIDAASVNPYYKNRASDEPFLEGTTSLDYSLQLSVGIAKFRQWLSARPSNGTTTATAAARIESIKLKDFQPSAKPKANVELVPASEAFSRGD